MNDSVAADLTGGLIPDGLVRDGAQIGPQVRFWHRQLGTCTALEVPDDQGRFRATFVQYLANGRRQEVTASFHVGMVAR